MKDQPSTSGDSKEPHRPKTIPDDFIYDPVRECWYPPGEPSPFTAEYWLHFLDDLRPEDYGGPDRLISRDELLAAGALNVSPGRRKSLSVEREHLPLFPDDDDASQEEELPGPRAED